MVASIQGKPVLPYIVRKYSCLAAINTMNQSRHYLIYTVINTMHNPSNTSYNTVIKKYVNRARVPFGTSSSTLCFPPMEFQDIADFFQSHPSC